MSPNHHLVALALPFALAACSGTSEQDDDPPSCEEDTRDEEYVSGISKLGEAGYTVSIMDSLPAPPARDNNVWQVLITDEVGAPASDVALDTYLYMPDHGHPNPLLPTALTEGGGLFTLDPVNFFMPGLWEITLSVIDPGETESPDDDIVMDSMLFKFCIEG